MTCICNCLESCVSHLRFPQRQFPQSPTLNYSEELLNSEALQHFAPANTEIAQLLSNFHFLRQEKQALRIDLCKREINFPQFARIPGLDNRSDFAWSQFLLVVQVKFSIYEVELVVEKIQILRV